MPSVDVREDDLIRILLEAKEAGDDPQGALTTREIKERIGWNIKKIRRRLEIAKQAGKVEVVRKYKITLSNTRQTVPAYRLVAKDDQ